MSEVSPEEAFDLITDEMGLRAVAVALYRVMTSDNPVLVVQNEKRNESLEILIKATTKSVSTTLFGPEERREGPGFLVTTKEEYKENWKKFAGKEVCMVEQETTVKNPGVDLMEKTLNNALGTLAVTPIDRISRTIGRVVSTTEQIRARFEGKEKGEIDISNLKQTLKHTIGSKVERKLVKHVLEIWGIEVL